MNDNLSKLAASWGNVAEELKRAPRVLLVEDDAAAGAMFAAVLERANYACDRAETGEAALELFATGRYACLLVDKNLPDIDGIEVIRRAKAADPDCEAVIVTGYANLDSISAAMNLRAADYLTKPLDSIDVLTTVIGRADRRRQRRLLARRVLADLRQDVSQRAGDETAAHLVKTRDEIAHFRESLAGKKRVLLSSNESSDVQDAVRALEAEGYTVWTRATTDELYAVVRRRHISALLLSDDLGTVPASQLAENVRELSDPPELIFVTAKPSFGEALEAIDSGAAGYITKPLRDPQQLQHAIRRACQDQHEQMVHATIAQKLLSLGRRLGESGEAGATRQHLESALGDLDIITAEHVIPPRP